MRTDDLTSAPPSPLRERQRQETRIAIFEGVVAVLDQGELTDLSFPAIATASGVSERTIYRHFPDLDALLDAFWPWFVESLGIARYSSSAAELAANPPKVFKVFDRHAGLIRALISSKVGRAARDRGNAERKAAFHAAIVDAVGEVSPEDELTLAAATYAIYSGYGWASMRDFWNLDGDASGQAAVTALRWLFDGYKADRDRRTAQRSTPTG